MKITRFNKDADLHDSLRQGSLYLNHSRLLSILASPDHSTTKRTTHSSPVGIVNETNSNKDANETLAEILVFLRGLTNTTN